MQQNYQSLNLNEYYGANQPKTVFEKNRFGRITRQVLYNSHSVLFGRAPVFVSQKPLTMLECDIAWKSKILTEITIPEYNEILCTFEAGVLYERAVQYQWYDLYMLLIQLKTDLCHIDMQTIKKWLVQLTTYHPQRESLMFTLQNMFCFSQQILPNKNCVFILAKDINLDTKSVLLIHKKKHKIWEYNSGIDMYDYKLLYMKKYIIQEGEFKRVHGDFKGWVKLKELLFVGHHNNDRFSINFIAYNLLQHSQRITQIRKKEQKKTKRETEDNICRDLIHGLSKQMIGSHLKPNKNYTIRLKLVLLQYTMSCMISYFNQKMIEFNKKKTCDSYVSFNNINAKTLKVIPIPSHANYQFFAFLCSDHLRCLHRRTNMVYFPKNIKITFYTKKNTMIMSFQVGELHKNFWLNRAKK